MGDSVRLAYLVSHPIQYQAGLLRLVAQEPDIDLKVFFCSDYSVREYADPGFGRSIQWDVPLLEGYRYEFLPALGKRTRATFWKPFNYGFLGRLVEGRFDALWIHGYARWFHWVAMVAAKMRGIPTLVRDEVTEISTRRGPIKILAKRVFFYFLNMMCDKFLAIGTLNHDYYRQQGIREDKIHLVPYTVDNAFFQAEVKESQHTREELRASLGLEPGRPIILFVGKLVERKRPVDLLEAYIRLSPDGRSEPHPYLVFIGDGSLKISLETRASELGWGSIKFLGFKNQKELPRYYNLCDVFVLPSLREAWGLVVNEVMNAGRSVILSDQVGCGPDLVIHGENGFVYMAGSITELHRLLKEILSDPRRCQAMGRKSLEIIDSWSYEEDIKGLRQALGIYRDGYEI